MRKVFYTALRLAPFSTLFVLGSCGVTDLQLRDFITTTGVQVFSQGLTDFIGALILAGQ